MKLLVDKKVYLYANTLDEVRLCLPSKYWNSPRDTGWGLHFSRDTYGIRLDFLTGYGIRIPLSGAPSLRWLPAPSSLFIFLLAKYKSSYGDSELGNYSRAPRIGGSWKVQWFNKNQWKEQKDTNVCRKKMTSQTARACSRIVPASMLARLRQTHGGR